MNPFRKSCNWDILTHNFDSVLLNDLIVEKVLLELKEPTNAKRALAFFHWSAQRKKFEHGNWFYCITIHIMDAQALLESVLKKNAGSPLRFFSCEFSTLKFQDYCFNSICV